MKFPIILFSVLLATASAHGQIFVTNYASGTIGEYNFDGSTANASLISGLVNPVSLAVSGTTLYVGNQGPFNGFENVGGTVGAYSTSGGTINAAFITGLQDPFGLAVSGSNLYVSDIALNTIGEYNALTGQAINASLISGLNGPRGLAIVGSNLYVASSDGTIGEYTTAGATVNATLVTGLSNPFGLVVSGSDLFVSNLFQIVAGNGVPAAIGEYDATSGQTVNSSLISLTGSVSPNAGFASLGSDLFVAQSNNTIGEYTTTGDTVNASLVPGLSSPVGVAVAVPEPSTWGLLVGTAAMMMGAMRRRARTTE